MPRAVRRNQEELQNVAHCRAQYPHRIRPAESEVSAPADQSRRRPGNRPHEPTRSSCDSRAPRLASPDTGKAHQRISTNRFVFRASRPQSQFQVEALESVRPRSFGDDTVQKRKTRSSCRCPSLRGTDASLPPLPYLRRGETHSRLEAQLNPKPSSGNLEATRAGPAKSPPGKVCIACTNLDSPEHCVE